MSSSRVGFVVLFLFAFALRAGYALSASPIVDSDGGEYIETARGILRGEGYHLRVGPGHPFSGDLRAYRIPGYSFFLACVFRMFGENLAVVRTIQCLAGAGTVLLIWGIGDTFSRRVAWTAGIAAAVYPDLVYHSAAILAEPLHIACFTGALLLLLRAGCRPPANLVAGLVWGAATMFKTNAVTFLPFVWIWVFLRHPWKTALARAGAATLGFALVVGPWVSRNAVVLGTPMLSSDAGRVFYEANNPSNVTGQGATVWLRWERFHHLAEAEQSKAAGAEGMKYLRSLSAKRLLVFETKKIASFLYPFEPRYNLAFGFLFPLWIWGSLLALRRRDGPGLLLLGVTLSFVAGVLTVTGIPRFREPLAPVILVHSAVAAEWLFEGVRARRVAILLSAWGLLQVGIFFASAPIRALVKRTFL